jgi:hypothetical protein
MTDQGKSSNLGWSVCRLNLLVCILHVIIEHVVAKTCVQFFLDTPEQIILCSAIDYY